MKLSGGRLVGITPSFLQRVFLHLATFLYKAVQLLLSK
ncbi:hypothetical protein RNAN_0764 [Rheinheimera nanhaiensis E407-8]|uniref:Uncharacterized protein n=1 Tax=Rheinheimera nanhaiensis E407-8 TaxID=562729 RepID=I1DUR7_9GAMM|nr:hypothetical protein RNAN_0764 [Rheinheimera nanhaiensis E407-8]